MIGKKTGRKNAPGAGRPAPNGRRKQISVRLDPDLAPLWQHGIDTEFINRAIREKLQRDNDLYSQARQSIVTTFGVPSSVFGAPGAPVTDDEVNKALVETLKHLGLTDDEHPASEPGEG